jgi:hypothetical protein
VIVMLIDLGGGDIKFAMQSVKQGFQAAPLLLQGCTPRKTDFQQNGINMHAGLPEDGCSKITHWSYNTATMRIFLRWVSIVLVVMILVIIGYWLVSTLRGVTQPMTDLGHQLGTQVSQILNPTPTVIPDPITIVREVRAIARLETIQYTVEKVLTGETNQGAFGFLFGDKLLFVAHGIVIAGVDLGQLTAADIWYDDLGVLTLRLPEAEIFISTLDNDKSYVYDRDTGLLTHGDMNLESIVRQAAVDEITNAALEDGILEHARVNAENYLYRLLRSLGFDNVIFVDADAEPPPTPTVTPFPTMTPTPSD